MKAMNLTIQRNIVVVMTVILTVLTGTVQVAAVEYKNSYQPSSVMGQNFAAANQMEAPSAVFQSTSSTMMNSGSAYSANPTLNEEGTATLEGASYSPAQAPSGPKKVGGHAQEGTPIGDAVLPLLFMSLAFGLFVYFRRKQTLKS